MMDLNKHIVTDDKNPFHSHGFAKLAHGEQIGSSANVNFGERLKLENNRQLISAYNKSSIGNTYSVIRAKTADKPDRTIKRSQIVMPRTRIDRLSVSPRKFSEPPARTYNPFS